MTTRQPTQMYDQVIMYSYAALCGRLAGEQAGGRLGQAGALATRYCLQQVSASFATAAGTADCLLEQQFGKSVVTESKYPASPCH